MGMLDDRFVREVGGYMISPTRLDSWDAIADLLVALASQHPEYFHRVMHGMPSGCRTPRPRSTAWTT